MNEKEEQIVYNLEGDYVFIPCAECVHPRKDKNCNRNLDCFTQGCLANKKSAPMFHGEQKSAIISKHSHK